MSNYTTNGQGDSALGILQAAELNWPEDEAYCMAKTMYEWKLDGDTVEELEEYRKKTIERWRGIFMRHEDGESLFNRFLVALEKEEVCYE